MVAAAQCLQPKTDIWGANNRDVLQRAQGFAVFTKVVARMMHIHREDHRICDKAPGVSRRRKSFVAAPLKERPASSTFWTGPPRAGVHMRCSIGQNGLQADLPHRSSLAAMDVVIGRHCKVNRPGLNWGSVRYSRGSEVGDVAPRIHGCGAEFAKIRRCHFVSR